MKPQAPANRKCLRVTRLISAAQDENETLSQAERLMMRLHLLLCPECRAFRRNTETLHEIMKRYADISEDGQAAGSDAAPRDGDNAAHTGQASPLK